MDKINDNNKYWLTIGRNVRFTAALFNELYATNIPIEQLFFMNEHELTELNLSKRCIKEFKYSRDNFNPKKVLEELKNNQIVPVFKFEKGYPSMLRQIYDPPFILYKKGEADLNQLCLGVVGSRRPTDYGIRATESIVSDLAISGVAIVSGLAIGIDAIAHQATLNESGTTIAVLGCGLNRVYPSSSYPLAKDIIATGGAIISEFPFDTIPAKQNFPARNRIISGIAQGLIVTEAAEGSGSLITALSALSQDREVFAIPGSIFNQNSIGTNSLIRSGAHLCTSAKDVLDEFEIVCPEAINNLRSIEGNTETEKAIISCLKTEPRHIDIITKVTGLTQSDIGSTITLMEISAKVKHLGGNIYRLNN